MKKVAVLLSGGVDSAVALHYLLEKGYIVHAFYLKIWLEDELSFLGNCPWNEDISYIKKTCKMLNVPFDIIPLQKEYHDLVVNKTITMLNNGYTPNPDIFCNSMIKFGAFYKKFSDTFDYFATGHYAHWRIDNNFNYLSMTNDTIKDQTYFIAYTEKKILDHVLFPLGNFNNKHEVRNYAILHHLPSALKKDSQGVCFLGKIPFKEFIKHHCGEKKGFLIEFESKKKLATHNGSWFYTIGQRHSIGLSGGPWYVVDKNHDENIVWISKNKISNNINVSGKAHELNILAKDLNDVINQSHFIKLRHGPFLHTLNDIVFLNDTSFKFTLESPDQGIAEGQLAVLYSKDYRCLASGLLYR